MRRTVSAERTYSLGDYKNIKLRDEITDIPADVATNPEAMGLLDNLLLIGVESSYHRYIHLMKLLDNEEDKAKKLEEMRIENLMQLKVILNGHLTEN